MCTQQQWKGLLLAGKGPRSEKKKKKKEKVDR
jgi:hypothetical protein